MNRNQIKQLQPGDLVEIDGEWGLSKIHFIGEVAGDCHGNLISAGRYLVVLGPVHNNITCYSTFVCRDLKCWPACKNLQCAKYECEPEEVMAKVNTNETYIY